jgi:hypothetical protein
LAWREEKEIKGTVGHRLDRASSIHVKIIAVEI